MSINISDLARRYAELPYRHTLAPDVARNVPCWFATHPELPGCVAMGESEDAALASLREARIDYIQSLLDDGLTPPVPVPTVTVLYPPQ